MAEHKLVNDALLMAIWKRKFAKSLLWHIDWDSQYFSAFTENFQATRYSAKHEP